MPSHVALTDSILVCLDGIKSVNVRELEMDMEELSIVYYGDEGTIIHQADKKIIKSMHDNLRRALKVK